MNRKRMLELRETCVWLRDTPNKHFPPKYAFDFNDFYRELSCKTLLCLAGWYVHRNPDCGLMFENGHSYGIIRAVGAAKSIGSSDEVARVLDIPACIADQLFYPPDSELIDYGHGDLQNRRAWSERAVKQVDILLECDRPELKFYGEDDDDMPADWPEALKQLCTRLALCPVNL